MNKTIWFDLDGTLVSLYEVPNWLPMLRASDPTPYLIAKPMVRMSNLAYMLNRLRASGYNVGVISWTSKAGTPDYNSQVDIAKRYWLAKHLPSVQFDEIHIVPYGTPKQTFKRTTDDILFDDEMPNRENWGNGAFDVNNILEVLKNILREKRG